MNFSQTELNFWQHDLLSMDDVGISERDNQDKAREYRVVTEINREKLPVFFESLKRDEYINQRPFFQRRPRWNATQQSLLIESFLINIPIPPIILYETKLSTYEVMDGQQRINAIQSFYSDQLTLQKLEIYKDLNGCIYSTLPDKAKGLIDRRSISSIVIVNESASNPEEELFLKQTAFERLNTEGIKLNPQEVRNCVYSGKFNNLLKELSTDSIFRNAWKIPLSIDKNPDKSTTNRFYNSMQDLEMILRFFALRHANNYSGSLKGFLDLYMVKAQSFDDEDIDFLRDLFLNTLHLASNIYEKVLFCPYDPDREKWANRPLKAFYDAVMVSLSMHLDKSEEFLARKNQIVEGTKELFMKDEEELLRGKGKKKEDVQRRIKMFEELILTMI